MIDYKLVQVHYPDDGYLLWIKVYNDNTLEHGWIFGTKTPEEKEILETYITLNSKDNDGIFYKEVARSTSKSFSKE